MRCIRLGGCSGFRRLWSCGSFSPSVIYSRHVRSIRISQAFGAGSLDGYRLEEIQVLTANLPLCSTAKIGLHRHPPIANTASSLSRQNNYPSHFLPNLHSISYINSLSTHHHLSQPRWTDGRIFDHRKRVKEPTRSRSSWNVLRDTSTQRRRGEGSGQCTPHPP